MFGLKLKSWMEAHLGRPRHKSTTHQNQKRAPKDSSSSAVPGSSTSNSNSTCSSSTNTSSSITTAIIGVPNNPFSPDIQSALLPEEKTCNFSIPDLSCSATTSSSTVSSSVLGLESGGTEGPLNGGISPKENGGAIGPKLADAQSPQDHHHPLPTNTNLNGSSRPTVTTSVSNSTSILSGSFSNSLSSPDTGYSTDGYSPKSVYPALSFDSSSSTSSGHCNKSSKSSFTISSLASNELLSKQVGSSSGERVQNEMDHEYPSTAPSPSSPAALTVSTPFSQSCSSGISESSNSFPKGQHHESRHQQPSIPEVDSKKQVIIEGDEDAPGQKRSILSSLQQKTSQSPAAASSPNSSIDPLLTKFTQFNIDFSKIPDASVNKHGRTHRRAESMDARTPSHEDYKPLVQNEDEGLLEQDGGNSSLMTGQGKNIRTFVLNNSGHIVEFSSYKNAYSICSPRRERTRIKTNPWIIINNKGASASDSSAHANIQQISSGSEEEAEKGKEMSSSLTSNKPIIPGETKGESNKRESEPKSNHALGDHHPPINLEINKRPGPELTDEEHFVEDETGITDQDSSSSLLYRISNCGSASDSGKGSLEPTNRNSTESSCLLSDSTTASTRNSIISHETERSGTRSSRSCSGDSISSHNNNHREDDTLGHASPTSCSDTPARLFPPEENKEQQHQRIHHSVTVISSEEGKKEVASSGPDEPRTFRNAAVETDSFPESASQKFHKSASVSVGVGTTSSNKSPKAPIMVDKETDILSDWANTDEDGDEEIETDADRNDNETVTPAPSSPDGDRALFSQSTSSATDIDFGDSSAATQASSTAVFPPSSLLRHNRFSSNNNNGSNRENGASFHYTNDGNVFPNGGSGGEPLIATSQMLPGSYDHQHHYQHNINILPGTTATATTTATSYPSVPIIRPVLAAAAQHQNGIPDAFTYDIATGNGTGVLVNHNGELIPHHFHHPDLAAMCYGGAVPNFNLAGDDCDYPEIKSHKGIARGALGFLRKIFKKGACSTQRHSPDSVKGKKSRGKSDNNLAGLGLGSPLLTISEPLSNPRYSAVLTTKKQMNGVNGYFLTPTPNSFRRRSGTATDSSDSKSSKQHSSTKSVKTDIIRLPHGTLSPQDQVQQHHQRQTSSSGSSSSSGISSGMGGQACSTFFPPNNFHQLSTIPLQSIPPGPNNLVQSQSNTNTNSTSASSSIHSLMSTSTSASTGNNATPQRPPSQAHSKAPYYVNMSNSNCNGTRASQSMSPPPLISENALMYSNESKNPQHPHHIQNCRRDQHHHSQSPSMKIPPYESPRLGASGSATANARMNSPSFNNYSPIHRLVVTGGTHLLTRTSNPVNPPSSTGLIHYPQNSESPHLPRYSNVHATMNGNNNGVGNNNNPTGFPITASVNRHHHHPTSSPSPLINHRYPSTSSPHQYPPSQQQKLPGHLFPSPSPILRNPRYQYITSSNQNSPVLNGSKRNNMIPSSHVQIIPSSCGPSGQAPLLTTFAPLPSSSSAGTGRESLINNNSFNTNTISGSPNLNTEFNQRTRQPVSSSLSYNEFENFGRQQEAHFINGNAVTHLPHHIPLPQQQHPLHQSHKGKIHQNHYYSSPIVKGAPLHQHHQPYHLKQTWNSLSEEQERNLGNGESRQFQQKMNQNLRFNSFLTSHRQLPRFYHTQWGLQERIYESVDSEGEQTNSDEMSGCGYDQDGNEMERSSELSLPMEVHRRRMQQSFGEEDHSRMREVQGNFLLGQNNMMYPESSSNMMDVNEEKSKKRSKPNSLSASGKPLPRPVVALPMMPGTFLSETETRLLEFDKDSDRKYKRLINEAEALLKEISVEKIKRGAPQDNNPFRLEDCPQSDPLRRKAYDCWALRRLQQELAGCCASPPVLHRSRLNLQSPLTPTVTNNPFLSHFQSMAHPPLMEQAPLPYMNSVDNNQNSFDF